MMIFIAWPSSILNITRPADRLMVTICQHCYGNNRGFKAGGIIGCGKRPYTMMESKNMRVAQRDLPKIT